jgi:hypothetical protein
MIRQCAADSGGKFQKMAAIAAQHTIERSAVSSGGRGRVLPVSRPYAAAHPCGIEGREGTHPNAAYACLSVGSGPHGERDRPRDRYLLGRTTSTPARRAARPDDLAEWKFAFNFDKVLLFSREPDGTGEVIEIQRA